MLSCALYHAQCLAISGNKGGALGLFGVLWSVSVYSAHVRIIKETLQIVVTLVMCLASYRLGISITKLLFSISAVHQWH